MRVLHLFDWYLPSTLSWVSRLLHHLPEAEVEIGAPWIVHNRFYQARFRHYPFPVQQLLFPAPQTEWEHPHWQRLLARSQRFWPIYPQWLERRLRAAPPEVLHAHFGPTGCLYLPLARKLDRPLVVTFYGFDYQKLLVHRPVFRRKYRELFAGAAKIVVASPKGAEALEALGCPPGKLAQVRPSPDLEWFPFAERHKPAGRLRLVQAATYTEKKGHLTTLEAFRRALPQCPNLHLTLAGEPYDPAVVHQVNQYIRLHGLEACVDQVGTVPHEGMAAFLARFDAFIHPSCTTEDGDHEAIAVVLLEAQATGLPVLATRHFDLAEAVDHGRAGWLVPERDAEALAQAIQMFYQFDDTLYQTYSRNARTWVEKRFTVQASAGQLRNIYREWG